MSWIVSINRMIRHKNQCDTIPCDLIDEKFECLDEKCWCLDDRLYFGATVYKYIFLMQKMYY